MSDTRKQAQQPSARRPHNWDPFNSPQIKSVDSDETWLHHNFSMDDAPSLYASCYYGEDAALNPVFVKRYRDANEHAIRRLTEESHTVQAFRGHRNIIQLVGVGKVVDEDWCLIYELGDHTLTGQPHSKELAAAVAREIGAALEAVHARDLVHCDVAPNNLIRVRDSWKLADFDNCVPAGSRTSGQPKDERYLLPGRNMESLAEIAFDTYALDAIVAEYRA